MHLVPAPAVRLMKRRVLSRPGVYSLMSYGTPGQGHQRCLFREVLGVERQGHHQLDVEEHVQGAIMSLLLRLSA